jgi:hypothetical protein
MADNTVLNTGTGGDTISTDDIAGVKVQRVKVQHGADGSATDVSTASPLPVDQTNTTVADGGTLPAKGVQVGGTDGSVFQVISTDNAGRVNTNINGTVTTTGGLTDTQLRASAVPVSGPLTDTQLRASAVPVDTELPAAAALADAASNPTAPAAGAFGMLWNGATWDRAPGSTAGGLTTNLKQLNGTTVATNSGNKDAGTQRVVIATDQPQLTNALKVDGSAVTQPVSGTVTANLGTAAVTNAGTFAVQIAANSSINNAQVAGTATSVNSGAKDAGTQRVILASDQTVVPVSDNSGSLTVDAPVGTPVFTTVTPSTTGGWSKGTALAQTTTKKAVKASAGTFGGYYAYNPNASVAYIQVFDLASASVTVGTTAPDLVFGIPASSAANLEFTNGVNMATAITLACTTTATGSTAPGTGLDLTLLFK